MGIDADPLDLMGIDENPDLREMLDQLAEGEREAEMISARFDENPDLQEILDQLAEGDREAEMISARYQQEIDAQVEEIEKEWFGPDP